MKERILELLRKAGGTRTDRQLSSALDAPIDEIQKALDDLSVEGLAVQTRKGGWAVPEAVGLALAKAAFQRNGTPLAQLVSGGAAMPIIPGGAARVLPGDLILVRPDGERCQLKTILRRGRDTFPAYVRIERKAPKGAPRNRAELKTVATAVPCDVRIPYDVVLTGDLSFVRNDQIALLKIEKYPEMSRPIYASVERVLGNEGSLPALMKAVAEDQGFATELSDAVLAESDAMPADVRPEDIAGREDLRDLLAFTIDGATAKDFDDAVSIGSIEGGWRLGVHIADVSHYVRPGSAIDEDAYRRGTSLYLPGLTVPMLPECLSNNLCSLMPEMDRLALSLFMDIKNGAVVDHLSRGTIVVYRYSKKGWWYVDYRGGSGYVDRHYLWSVENSTSKAKYAPVDNLWVHTKANVDSWCYGKLKAGKQVTIEKQSGTWVLINYKGHTGWVSSKYLRRVK